MQAAEPCALRCRSGVLLGPALQAHQVLHVLVQERLSKFPNLQSLRISGKPDDGCWLSSHALAQCPVLRVVELCNYVFLSSPGTFEEGLQALKDSSLQVLKIHFMGKDCQVRTRITTLLSVVLLRLCSRGLSAVWETC